MATITRTVTTIVEEQTFMEASSMTKGSWKQIYPKDCYNQMLILAGETDVSFPKVVNILVREGLIRLGKIPEDTSEAYLITGAKPPPSAKEKMHACKVTILWVKNVGNTEFRYSWNVVDFPNQQFSISNAYFEDGPNQWVELNQNEVCPTVLMTPGDELKINFTLTCTDFSAGSYSFTLNLMSNDG